MVVEALASCGTFKIELLINTNVKRVITAKAIDNINFQLKINEIIFFILYRFPEISFLSPNNTIEHTLVIQKIITNNIKISICRFLFLLIVLSVINEI